jgi:enamine deaminase RidA (YjgF/YER057c/UK114 family)
MRRNRLIHAAYFAMKFVGLYCAARKGRPARGRARREEPLMTVHHRQNPPTIHKPRGYSHVVEASAPGRTIYIAGQVGMAPDGKIASDFAAQVTQCFENLKAALAAAGAGFEHVVKTTNYFIDIGQIPVFREVRDRYVDTKAPPASTAVQVVKLAAPEFLFEIEAIAVVPDK